AVLVLIALNWLLLRARLYLLYLGYIGMLLVHGIAYSGLAAQYLPEWREASDLMVGIGLSMAAAFGLAFFDRMLDLDPVQHRRLRRWYMFTSSAAVLTAMATVTGWYLYFSPVLQVCLVLVIIFTLPLGWARVRHGS